jgi:hypothetical protein
LLQGNELRCVRQQLYIGYEFHGFKYATWQTRSQMLVKSVALLPDQRTGIPRLSYF